MPKYRAYIYSPQGSPSCPANLPNGCFNTGMYDSDLPRGYGCLDPDPLQFATYQDMANYARSRDETLLEVSTVAEINRLCSAGVTPLSAPAPSSIPGAGTYTPFVSVNQGYQAPASCAVAGGGSRVGGEQGSPAPQIVNATSQAIQVRRVIDLSREFPQNSISF